MNRLNRIIFDRQNFPTYVLTFCILFTTPSLEAKDIIGRVEKVGISNANFVLRAKIDTGATNSSLHATNYHLSVIESQKWISFDVTNQDGKTITLKKQILRFVKVKRKEATTQQRPAIMLDVCVGKIKKVVEVNLVNRGNFDYQMLIGQSFLQGSFIVDVQQSYTQDPDC